MSAATSQDKLRFKGFSDSKQYENVRPEYPREAVEFMLTKLGALSKYGTPTERKVTILELGAGTGKFTRVMLDVLRGAENVRIVASDPLEGMCEKFREMLPGVEMKQFAAENIDFPDESIDAVVASGCLHWFCDQKSLGEIYRVLVPCGIFGITWNFLASGLDEDSQWVVEICDYLDPVYKKNLIRWPLLHYKEIMKELPKEKFSEPEDTDKRFLYKMETNFERTFAFLLSLSTVASFTLQEREQFREFYEGVLDKYFRSQGKELKSLTFAIPVVWCKKNPRE